MLLWQIDTVKALNILLWQSINKGNEHIIIFYITMEIALALN